MTVTVGEVPVVAVREQLERYRSENGFAVELNRYDDRIFLRTGAVEAVQMGELLGESVRTTLSAGGLRTPIIANTSTGYWTFLTGPAEMAPVCVRPAQFGSLQELSPLTERRDWSCVIRSVAGVQIPLPGPKDADREWQWPPVGRVSVGAGLVSLDHLVAVIEEHLL